MSRQPATYSGRVLLALVVVAVFAAACGPEERVSSTSEADSAGLGGGVYGVPPDGEREESLDQAVGDPPSEAGDGFEAECDSAVIGDDEGEVTVVYRVRNGQLDDACFGDPEPIAEEGWDMLALVVPPEQLTPIAFYAAYEGETDTLAFAGPVDDDNDDFVIAIDAVAGADDLEELQLTLLHEFAHVFTQTPDQLDLSVSLLDCPTYWNGFGCFKPGSFMAEWIAEFWPQEVVETLPKKGGIDEDGGSDRCNIDPQYLGSYAASHPEEDFAETFSAYVFAVDVPAAVQPRIAFFRRQPEIVAFSDRAEAADRTGLSGNFDRCG